MNENEIAKQVLDCAFLVHTRLGPGLLESVYEVVLAHELRKKALIVERQKPMPIVYDGVRFNEAFRSDLVVNAKSNCRTKVGGNDFWCLCQAASYAVAVEWIKTRPAHKLWNGIKRIINVS